MEVRLNKLLCTLACAGMVSLATAGSPETGVGIGFIFGNPSGISVKIPTGANSVNFTVGYELRHEDVALRGEYVWYAYELIPVQKGKLPLYFGPGLQASIRKDPAIGVHGVVGLEYQFADLPFDAFLEVGPGISVIPSTRADLSVGLGARFFF